MYKKLTPQIFTHALSIQSSFVQIEAEQLRWFHCQLLQYDVSFILSFDHSHILKQYYLIVPTYIPVAWGEFLHKASEKKLDILSKKRTIYLTMMYLHIVKCWFTVINNFSFLFKNELRERFGNRITKIYIVSIYTISKCQRTQD